MACVCLPAPFSADNAGDDGGTQRNVIFGVQQELVDPLLSLHHQAARDDQHAVSAPPFIVEVCTQILHFILS